MTEQTINIHVTQDRAELLVLDDLIDATEGDLRGMRSLLAHFVQNGKGEYMKTEEAVELIGKMTLKEIKASTTQVVTSIEETSSPKENGTT